MRVLLLLRGSPACGKSTFIKEHGLEPYALSADEIRLLYSSPIMNPDGTVSINQKKNGVAWNTLYTILENRMRDGEFTVIDATMSKTAEMSRMKKLAQQYRYRVYVVDFTDVDINLVKARNLVREEYKRVPEHAIDNQYARFETQKVPSGITVIKPNELDTILYRKVDLSEYKRVHIFGDIHGCYSALKNYFEKQGIDMTVLPRDEAFIFIGDYIDRGIESGKTMKFLLNIMNEENVFLLEGNHEQRLREWASDPEKFERWTAPFKETIADFAKEGVSYKDIRKFCSRLGQCAYFEYDCYIGKVTVLVTHGGIAKIPDNLIYVPTRDMIHGIGGYEDAKTCDETWSNWSKGTLTYQIHGHRNVLDEKIWNTTYTFNLEGKVEFGGDLRVVTLNKSFGFGGHEIRNEVYKKEIKTDSDEEFAKSIEKMEGMEIINDLRSNKNIIEKQFGNLSSFNFTRNVFYSGAWDSITTRARGLYLNNKTGNVAMRGYDKFFNIGEREETDIQNLQRNLTFPVKGYLKENGFLVLMSYNKRMEDGVLKEGLVIGTKSTLVGEHVTYARNVYNMLSEETRTAIEEFLKTHNVTMVFECCDSVNDPHIIKYNKPMLYLLDIVGNDFFFGMLSYEDLLLVGNDMLGFDKEEHVAIKEKTFTFNTWEEFYDAYKEIISEGYQYNGKYVEGFVFCDAKNFMVKLKTDYYKTQKSLRSMVATVFRTGNFKYTGALLDPYSNRLYKYCRDIFDLVNVKANKKDVFNIIKSVSYIELRDMFEADMSPTDFVKEMESRLYVSDMGC